MSARDRRLAELGVAVTVCVWAANFVVVKASLGLLGPLTFTSLRYVVAAVTLLLVLRWRQGPIRWPRGQARALFGLGAIGFGGYQVLWSIGLTQVTAGDSALLIATSPVLVALLAGAVGMDHLTPPKLLGALLAFSGVAIVVGAGHGLSLGASIVGDLLTLGAATTWAIYTTGGARVLRVVDPLVATTWTVVSGTLVLLPFGLWEVMTRPPTSFPISALPGIVYAGALAAGIANVFVFNAIRYVGPTRVTAMQFLVPAGAVVLGALFLHEPVGAAQVVGGAVIVLGVMLTRRAAVVPVALRSRLSSG